MTDFDGGKMRSEGSDSTCSSDSDASEVSLRPEDFTDRVVIGRGRESTVYSAYCSKLDGRAFAVKVYDKSRLSPSKLRAVRREASMMAYITRMQVPHTTRLVGAFQDDSQVWLVEELGEGGDLLQRFLKEGCVMTEPRVCRRIALPLLNALRALHDLRIIHRDLKLENCFLRSNGDIMLGDFGLTMSTKQELAVSPVGTVEYMAPEVVSLPPIADITSGTVAISDITPCTDRVDIWALGVLVYELMTGRLPFEGKDRSTLKRNIMARKLRPFPVTLSPGAIDFINQMMTVDPTKRPSAAQLLHHPFMWQHVMAIVHLPLAARTEDNMENEPLCRKALSLQGLAELGSTADSGPLIMARHGDCLAHLTTHSLGRLSSTQSAASEACSDPAVSLARTSRGRSLHERQRMAHGAEAEAGQEAARSRHQEKSTLGRGTASPLGSSLSGHVVRVPMAGVSPMACDSFAQQKASQQPVQRQSSLRRLTSRMKSLLWSSSGNAVCGISDACSP